MDKTVKDDFLSRLSLFFSYFGISLEFETVGVLSLALFGTM